VSAEFACDGVIGGAGRNLDPSLGSG